MFMQHAVQMNSMHFNLHSWHCSVKNHALTLHGNVDKEAAITLSEQDTEIALMQITQLA